MNISNKESKLLSPEYKAITLRLFSTLYIIGECNNDKRTRGIPVFPERYATEVLKKILQNFKGLNFCYNYLSLAKDYIVVNSFYQAKYAVLTPEGEKFVERVILKKEEKESMLNNLKRFIEKELPKIEKNNKDVALIIIRTLKELTDDDKPHVSQVIAPHELYATKGFDKTTELIKEAKQELAKLAEYDEKTNTPIALAEYTYVNSKGIKSLEEYSLLPELSKQVKSSLKDYEDILEKFENEEKILEYVLLKRIDDISKNYYRPVSLYELTNHAREMFGDKWDIQTIKNIVNGFCKTPNKLLYEENNEYSIEPKETENFEKYLNNLKEYLQKKKIDYIK